MNETTPPTEPAQNQPSGTRKTTIRMSDIVIFAVIAVIIASLAFFIISKVNLKHDADAAQKVSDKAITALQHRSGTDAVALGTPTFKKAYTAAALTKQFKAIEVATTKYPTLIKTTVSRGDKATSVFFIYEYTALKVPFYVGTVITDKGNTWQLTQLSGSADSSKLLAN